MRYYESYKNDIKNKSTSSNNLKSQPAMKKNGLSYKEKLEYEQLMKKLIEQAEVRMEQIDVSMIEASADYGNESNGNEEKEQLEIHMIRHIARWSELEE